MRLDDAIGFMILSFLAGALVSMVIFGCIMPNAIEKKVKPDAS